MKNKNSLPLDNTVQPGVKIWSKEESIPSLQLEAQIGAYQCTAKTVQISSGLLIQIRTGINLDNDSLKILANNMGDTIYIKCEEKGNKIRNKLETYSATNNVVVNPGKQDYTVQSFFNQKPYLLRKREILSELNAIYEPRDIIHSTVATRLNSYLAEKGKLSVFNKEKGKYGVSSSTIKKIKGRLPEKIDNS